MKSFTKIATGLILFTIVSCSSSGDHNSFKRVSKQPVSPSPIQRVTQTKENFEDFFKKFNTDTLFQKQRTHFPLKGTFQLDPTDDNSDSTFYIDRADFFFIKLTEPNSNIVDGITRVQITGRDAKRTVILRMEDSGVHIAYTFLQKNGKWWFVGFYDMST